MVQLSEDGSETSGTSNMTQGYKESCPVWPYYLLSLSVALIAAGAYHLVVINPSATTCPFAFLERWNSQHKVGLSPHFGAGYSEILEFGSKKKLSDRYQGLVITKDELGRHGIGSPDPWLSVLGHVYDVTKGLQHYGSDGKYNFFTGRDGSRAYSTGDFVDSGLTDDITDMKAEQIGEIFNWINTFGKKYPLVGRLEGAFFTSTGKPTSVWRWVEQSLAELGAVEERKQALRREFPYCNSHYDKPAGKAEVWCTIKSGGISRNWSGVPRQLHIPGEKIRCACVEETKLNDPKLKPYPDCSETAVSCKLKI